MKEKVKFLILGILIGAVITAGVFILIKNNAQPNQMRDRNFERPQFDDGEFPSDMQKSKEGNLEQGKRNRGEENTTVEPSNIVE